MAEEDVIEEPQVEQQEGPGPALNADNTKRLAIALKKMDAAGESPDRIKAFVSAFHKQYDEQSSPIPKADFSHVERPRMASETAAAPLAELKRGVAYKQSTDPAILAERKKYDDMRTQAIQEIEGGDWKNQIFKGEKPALTDQDLPESSYQHADPDAIERYLDTKDLNHRDRYWMRNQLLNYGKQRQLQASIDERMRNNVRDIPEVRAAMDKANEKVMHGVIKQEDYDKTWKQEVAQIPGLENQLDNAYRKSAEQEYGHREQATANRLNNIGLDDKPLSVNAPFHDQITGTNKAMMGVLSFPADLGKQISGLLELGDVPKLSDLGYKLKVNADQMGDHYALPQNGELGNTLAGLVPQALDMAALSRLSGAVGRPIYNSLGRLRASGALGQFAEGAIGGLAVSPANSYVMAHQYYNDLIKQGMTPSEAGTRSDRFFVKNLFTDMMATPLQMGLLKLNSGPWIQRALGKAGESVVSGLHFAAQDFNQKSIDNPALKILDYAQNDPNAKETFLTGAALGFVQKAATDALHNWAVRSATNRMFDYGRQYGGDRMKSLPSNGTIANTLLSALEMKNTPGRPQELRNLIDVYKEQGIYSPEEADRISSVLDDVNAVRDKVPKYGNPFQKIAVFNELLKQHVAERYSEQSGNKGAAKGPEETIKESNERIDRIMKGQEPLYFVNGNETSKERLEEALKQDPSMMSRPGVRIDIKNDPEFAKELKNKKDAIQEQKSDADALRDASTNGPTMGQRNEGEGAVDEKSSGEEKGQGVTEARHSLTEHDEQGIASGQNQMPLSDEGVTKAYALKEEVRQNHNITKVVSSDLERAKETANIVAGDDIPVEYRKENRSMDLGDFGGMTDAEVKDALKWFADNPDAKKYDGPNDKFKGKELGESVNQYAKRVIDFHKEIDKEGPNTLLVNHSNNMNLWEAYKANGEEWNKEAIHDWIERPSPEPAEVHDQAANDKTGKTLNDNIERGEVPDEQLKDVARLFIQHGADEKGEPIPTVQPTDAATAGSNEPDEAPRQLAKGQRAPQNVPTPGQGQTAAGQNQGAQSVPGSASAPDAARLTRNAAQLIEAGRTDDQVQLYLKRKGMSDTEALAALGEAKANPISNRVKELSLEQTIKKYFGKEDDWLGNKELNKVNSQVRTREYQKNIKESVKSDATQKGVSWKDVDRAIHIYLDTQRNPQHLQEYYDKLTPQQKKIVDLSQKLNPEQLKVADQIKKEYETLGQQAKDAGLLKDVIDNYVARAWNLRTGKPATEESFKFSTSTRHQLQRTLDTILQGYAEGMTLKIEGASNNLDVLKQEIGNVIENKRLMEQGLSLKYDTGNTDANGKAIKNTLFTTYPQTGYAAIESPAFKKWTYSGKLEDYSADEKQTFGKRKDVLVTEDGSVLKKESVYAPEEVAKSLNNILASKVSKSEVVKDLQKTNAVVKQAILSYSGFHFLAFTRAHILSGKFNLPMKGVNPISAYKAGLEMLAAKDPHGEGLIRNGMTVNRQQDWNEALNEHTTFLGRQMDKLGFTKAVKDKLVNLNEQFHRYLFNTYGAGLKMFDGINLAKAELAKNPTADPNEVYARVAKLMNDTYGGINWERMRGTKMQNPANRRLTSMLLLAPDWTASNLRFAKKAIERGDEGNLYRKAWGRVILRGIALTAAANAIMAVWDDKDDDGNELSWPDAMARRASKALEIGKLRSTMIDITPLYHAIGGAKDKRAYYSIFGAYSDPIKMLQNFGDFVESKGSFLSKLVLEAATSQNWQHKEFTTYDELFGFDDKGQYTKTTEDHKAGDINPNTGEPYKRDQKAHEEGDEKGGQLAGQLTKWPKGGAHPVTYPQLPSFFLNEVRGMMPTAAQNFWQIASGENDATTGILNALGTGVLVSKEPKEKKDE